MNSIIWKMTGRSERESVKMNGQKGILPNVPTGWEVTGRLTISKMRDEVLPPAKRLLTGGWEESALMSRELKTDILRSSPGASDSKDLG